MRVHLVQFVGGNATHLINMFLSLIKSQCCGFSTETMRTELIRNQSPDMAGCGWGLGSEVEVELSLG